MKITVENPVEVVKEAFWLAWNACGGPMGMGIFQNNPGASKEDVWKNISVRGDYPGGTSLPGMIGVKEENGKGQAYGDYVFGRMMKLSLRWEGKDIEIEESKPRADYQSWCCKYPTYQSLVETAVNNLKR